MRYVSHAPLCALALALGLAAPASSAIAQTQSPCDSPYVIQPGDTLYQVTQQCRVRLETLLEANPQIGNIDSIAVGTELTIPGAQSPKANPANVGAGETGVEVGYRVKANDTLYSIAQEFGVTLEQLLDANPGIDEDSLEVGERIAVPEEAGPEYPGADGEAPSPADAAAISLQPYAGAPGTPITVYGEGLTPGATVAIGTGVPESEWETRERARVRDDGTIELIVDIPQTWEIGQPLVYVIETADGQALVSRQVDVVDRRDPDAGVGDMPDQPASGPASIYEGRISQGTECPVLTTPDGSVYSLTGLPDSISDGDYVELRATPAEMSFCMQGEGTLSVDSAHQSPPPARDRDPARAGGIALTREYAIGTWAAKGSDCRAPDFAIEGNAAGGQVVHATVAGERSTGYVQLGDSPAMIFDTPHRELALETRGPDGLALMPPAEGPVTLADARIEGDGVVFIKCAD